jgi:hypothetical protein
MKDLTISLPDEIYDSVVNLLKQIPNVILNEEDDIPEWHKDILERYKTIKKSVSGSYLWNAKEKKKKR